MRMGVIMMPNVQETNTNAQLMEQMAKEVNLAVKTLKDGTLPVEPANDRGDSNEPSS